MSEARGQQILSNLNPRQREAVTHTEGPLLILAGAGSGKTRVIVHRIAYLVETMQVSPYQILAVTFTNKAAQEMRARIQGMIPPEQSRHLIISTFHSACLKILRRHISLLGYPRDFVVYDAADQLALIKTGVETLEINIDLFPPRMLRGRISRLKHQLVTPEDYAGRSQDFGFDAALSKVYAHYQERLLEVKGLDFDDLIGYTIRLLESSPVLRADYRRRFRYMMIDEYQDTNHAQYRLIGLLTSEEKNICVVGDDDQSIYAFRGADLGNILSFERDFPEAKVVVLSQNYRSTGTILSAASAMIEKNNRRRQKDLWTENGDGEKIIWGRMADEKEEAAFVLKSIETLRRREGRPLSDFAILYRTNAQSRILEDTLRAAAIPYAVYGGLRFYDRKEVKDLIAYLRLMVYPDDEMSLRRIINLPPRGVGRVTLERLSRFAESERISLFDAMGRLDEIGISPQGRRGLRHFTGFLDALRETGENQALPQLIRYLIDGIAYLDYLKKTWGHEAESRIENVLELIAAVDQFLLHQGDEDRFPFGDNAVEEAGGALSDLKVFLDQVALVSSGEEDGAAKDGVTLMTLHSAKGLEFPVVFLAGMEEGLFPHSRSLNDDREMEEERRLCYVGMTRAKERLYLLSVTQRYLYGTPHWNRPSRFIKDLPERVIDVVESSHISDSFERVDVDGPQERPGERPGDRTNPPSAIFRNSIEPMMEQRKVGGRFSVGTVVRHGRFGIGRVERFEGMGAGKKITVSFETAGLKKLVLKYAKLETWHGRQ
ncbi:MAG: ATP-dependent helicase [Nitrospiria bacterium]